MEYIRDLKTVGKDDAVTAGGKGASLGEMIQAGIPVPPGFVTLSAAFERFLEETDLLVEIDAALDAVDKSEMHTVELASEKIQQLILDAKMPADIASQIEKGFERLGSPFVAVRSSATAEDGTTAAWAGQLESYLNTTTVTLIGNVQRCWASLFTPRAIFYRFEKDLDTQKISVAVVVQAMVDSELSGVAFSVHPVTQDRDQLIIEAGYGLGEAVVAGQITPDSYVVEKEPRRIIDTNVNIQSRALYRMRGGGNEWQDIPEPRASSQTLTDKQILELAGLVIRIEKHYGFPCDIEWAFEGGKFYILQSRPITTLHAERAPRTTYQKALARTMFLMDCEIWDEGERVALPTLLDDTYRLDPLFYHRDGQGVEVFYNTTDPNQDPSRILDYLTSRHDFFLELKKGFDTSCTDIRHLTQNGTEKDFKTLYALLVEVWPLIAISTIIAESDSADKVLVSLAVAVRTESDGVLHMGTEHLLAITHDMLPERYKEWAEYLSAREINSRRFPDMTELRERKAGYVYHRGVLHKETLMGYATKNGLDMRGYDNKDYFHRPETGGELRGTAAFAGKMQGEVVVVRDRSDVKKMKKGNILVTAMTTPNLIDVMNLASAFITDEGGITCHAAIIARELGKPCIIGTKIATQVLHDGDLVEVDADAGTVRLLERQ